MNRYCIMCTYPIDKTICSYCGTLYFTSLRPGAQKHHFKLSSVFVVGVALLRCCSLLCPLSPREVFGLLSFYYIVYRVIVIVIVIELSKHFLYDITVSLSNDIIEFLRYPTLVCVHAQAHQYAVSIFFTNLYVWSSSIPTIYTSTGCREADFFSTRTYVLL